jgi:hypothetical protein
MNSTDKTKIENVPQKNSKIDIKAEYDKVIGFISSMIDKTVNMSQKKLGAVVSEKYTLGVCKLPRKQGSISRLLSKNVGNIGNNNKANSRFVTLREIVAFAKELKFDIILKESSTGGGVKINDEDEREKSKPESQNAEFFRVNTANRNKITTTDPQSGMFEHLNNEYHCYFLPTFSLESVKENEKVWVEALLTIDNTKNPVSADFKITGQKSTIPGRANNKQLDKKYKGELIYANPKNHGHLHCILHCEDFVDFSFFTFKYNPPNIGPYDCTIAEVLTVGARQEAYPTSHRMFLSRCPIDAVDIIEKILPKLRMNKKSGAIENEKMEKVVTILTKKMETVVDILKEKYIHGIENLFVIDGKTIDDLTGNKGIIQNTLTELLQSSTSSEFDKIDDSLCLEVHSLLKEKYYNENAKKDSTTEMRTSCLSGGLTTRTTLRGPLL